MSAKYELDNFISGLGISEKEEAVLLDLIQDFEYETVEDALYGETAPDDLIEVADWFAKNIDPESFEDLFKRKEARRVHEMAMKARNI